MVMLVFSKRVPVPDVASLPESLTQFRDRLVHMFQGDPDLAPVLAVALIREMRTAMAQGSSSGSVHDFLYSDRTSRILSADDAAAAAFAARSRTIEAQLELDRLTEGLLDKMSDVFLARRL